MGIVIFIKLRFLRTLPFCSDPFFINYVNPIYIFKNKNRRFNFHNCLGRPTTLIQVLMFSSYICQGTVCSVPVNSLAITLLFFPILFPFLILVLLIDRAVAQAVSRWLPHAGGPDSPTDRACGVCGGQSGTGAGFLRVLLANHHSTNFSTIIITKGWHNRPIGGRSAEWTQLDFTPHYTN
jgi:hypothetical protein